MAVMLIIMHWNLICYLNIDRIIKIPRFIFFAKKLFPAVPEKIWRYRETHFERGASPFQVSRIGTGTGDRTDSSARKNVQIIFAGKKVRSTALRVFLLCLTVTFQILREKGRTAARSKLQDRS